MKKLFSILLITFLAFGAAAADLNAPMSKQITVRSEIERGIAAVAALPEPEDPLRYHRAVTAISYANQQSNEDTPGFAFGVNYAAWHTLWRALSSAAYSDKFEMAIAEAHANICYTIALGLQKQLQLSDADLCTIASSYYSLNEETLFPQLLKSKQFKDSYPPAGSKTAAAEQSK